MAAVALTTMSYGLRCVWLQDAAIWYIEVDARMKSSHCPMANTWYALGLHLVVCSDDCDA